MKRIISLLLVAIMVLSLAACGTGKPIATEAPEVSDATEAPADSETSVATEPAVSDIPDLSGVTIRILTNSAFTAGVDYTTILARWAQVEERTGCEIIWECIDTDYETVLNTRLAGDPSTAPDIVMVGNVTGASSYIEDGLLYDLTQAYDVCPNIKAFYTETNPEMADILTYVDGGIYQMASSSYVSYEDYVEYTGTTIDNHLWYRADLAAELGFTEEPETIDDWYEMLCAAKEAYPDMYIFDIGNNLVWAWTSTSVFASSFGVKQNFENSSNMFYVDDNGKVVFEPTQDNVKAWLTEMKKWNDAGLFHTNGANGDLYTNAAGGLTFASFFRGLSGHVTAYVETDPNIRYETVAMPTAEGYERAYGSRNPYGTTYAIVDNGDEDQCRAVAQFLDYAVYSDYGIACERMGPEGHAWNFDENGNVVLNPDIDEWAHTNDLHLLGAYMWGRFPSVFSADINAKYTEMSNSALAAADLDERLAYINSDAIETTAENMSFAFTKFVAPYMNEEDQEVANEILADLKTFTKEMFTNYVLGNKDLENWDTEFVQVVYDEFRLQELLDLYQKYVDAK